jgi:hypothetical protein
MRKDIEAPIQLGKETDRGVYIYSEEPMVITLLERTVESFALSDYLVSDFLRAP